MAMPVTALQDRRHNDADDPLPMAAVRAYTPPVGRVSAERGVGTWHLRWRLTRTQNTSQPLFAQFGAFGRKSVTF
jgi:hypothetical protein